MRIITARRANQTALMLLAALAAGCLLITCSTGDAPPPPDADGPRLVLFLVVDQCRADFLVRYAPLFEGGLRRLLDQGVRFSDAHHYHAKTQTAVGHASLATGCHPSHHGIIANYWYDPEEHDLVAAVKDDTGVDSPRRLLRRTLGDWIKDRWPESRVFTASGKDRAAILLGGHRADGAFWYDDKTGEMATSKYYYPRAPEWLAGFNETQFLDQYFGLPWEPLPIPEETLADLGVEETSMGPLHPSFPHVFGIPSLTGDLYFYDSIGESPWQDLQVAKFAEHLIEAEGLGLDEYPDLLGLSFSALDLVGHDYGPDSREMLDILLRLDQALADLFDFIDGRVGLDRTIVLLSGDHGVSALPEHQSAHGLPGSRLQSDEMVCLSSTMRQLTESLGERTLFLPGPFIDPEAMGRIGLEREELEQRVADAAGECPAVVKVWTRSELTGDPPADDPVYPYFANTFHPERSPDFHIQFIRDYVPSRRVATTHGSPYEYDTHVPLIFMVDGLEPALCPDRVHTVDAAPTLAGLIGLTVPDKTDGRDLADRMATGTVKPQPVEPSGDESQAVPQSRNHPRQDS